MVGRVLVCEGHGKMTYLDGDLGLRVAGFIYGLRGLGGGYPCFYNYH